MVYNTQVTHWQTETHSHTHTHTQIKKLQLYKKVKRNVI